MESHRDRSLLRYVCSQRYIYFPATADWFRTFGFTCVYLGFGGILLLSLYLRGILFGKPARFVGAIGTVAASTGNVFLLDLSVACSTNALFPGFVRRLLRILLSLQTSDSELCDRGLAIG